MSHVQPQTHMPGGSPDRPLDVLVAGGGPCGTAVAFRSLELEMNVLVIDRDDVLTRIRDYAKGKPIKPDFGGDDKSFPVGGDKIAQLQFEVIDKDEMCARWKGLYQDFHVPHAVGVELTALERTANGVWIVKAWNLRERVEQSFHARHVVIAMGRGVPRTFDIPGNLDGIAFRLGDPDHYVGSPVCVVGGGTSAAEAVIGVSNAKVGAEDPTTVHWFYRGDKMPLVSKALANEFFDAHLLNGNVRLHPNSEPMAIVTADDKQEYFSIRTDRRIIPGRPPESTQLEFPKDRCIACIGEDIPEVLLKSLGIHMVTGGPKSTKRMVVSRLFETVLPNVYMIGDVLSTGYLVAPSFDADPATFEDVKRRGNVKMALYEGVFVAEVIRQKLDGIAIANIQVTVQGSTPAASAGASAAIASLSKPVESAGPPAASAAPDRAAPETVGRLVRMAAENVATDEYPIRRNGVTTIGRSGCDINLPDDTMLADHHASISHGPDGVFLRDDGSTTGVFLKVPEARWVELSPTALVRVGRQFLRLHVEGGKPLIVHYDLAGNERQRYAVPERAIVLGREAPDLTLDPVDKSLSRRHLGMMARDGVVLLKDLKSLNGTYLKVGNSIPIEDGDEIRAGGQRFVVALTEASTASAAPTAVRVAAEPVRPVAHVAPPPPPPVVVTPPPPQPAPQPVTPLAPQPAPSPAPATAPQVPAKAPAGEASITIQSLGKTLAVKRGQTICEVLEANGVHIDADCHAGACGSDPVHVLEGQENLNPCGDGETDTLDTFCSLQGGPYRLSCMAKPKGPIVIELVKK